MLRAGLAPLALLGNSPRARRVVARAGRPNGKLEERNPTLIAPCVAVGGAGTPGMMTRLEVQVLLEPYWRESNVNSSCTNISGDGRAYPMCEPARGCEMEAGSEAQHRTEVNSDAGWPVWVSTPEHVMPDIQSWQDSTRSGGGAKSCHLILGDLWRSSSRGRTREDTGSKPTEKSDHLIVAMKPGNAGGAKGVTG